MKIDPIRNFVQCSSIAGLHQVAYWEWPARHPTDATRTILCAHGLTRNGRDFDALAEVLSETHRVICVDFVGRGDSDWLTDPMLYAIPQYVADVVTLIARLHLNNDKGTKKTSELIWIGTSMGGLVGMVLAAMQNTPISALVLNDIGPELAPEGVKRIGTYVGETPVMFSYRQAADFVIANSASFGSHTPEQWELFTRHYVKQKGDRWVFNYDPAIAVPFRLSLNQVVNLWPFYDLIKVPTHVLRGAQSDLFSEDIANQMTQRGPNAGLSTLANVGHAPSLLVPNQIQIIQQFIHSLS